jgi:hypothetical protein
VARKRCGKGVRQDPFFLPWIAFRHRLLLALAVLRFVVALPLSAIGRPAPVLQNSDSLREAYQQLCFIR